MILFKLFCRKYIDYLLLGILLTVFLYHYLFPEFVQINNSINWDANTYTSLTKQFPELVTQKQINIYYSLRILPSVLIYYTFRLFSIPLSELSIRTGFLVLNMVLILTSFMAWLSICRVLQLSVRNKVLGFSGLFLNYAIIKMPFYYPVLTDVMAFTLGTLMLLCYLKDYPASILLISLLGAFTFPTLLYSGLLLYIFPIGYLTPEFSQTKLAINRVFALVIPLVFFLLIVVFYFYRKVPLINPNSTLILIISILAASVYIYLVARLMIRIDLYKSTLLKFNRWNRVIIAILCVCLVFFVSRSYSSSEQSIFNYKGFLANIVIVAIANPFNFLVAHAIYLGPLVFILLYEIKSFYKTVELNGLGLHLLIFGYCLLSVCSESRLFMNAWPFFVAFLCLSLEKHKISDMFYFSMPVLSLVWSKFWFRINTDHFTGNYFAFPDQRYFMSQGPWMSDAMYLLQGTICLITFGLMYFLFLANRTAIFKN